MSLDLVALSRWASAAPGRSYQYRVYVGPNLSVACRVTLRWAGGQLSVSRDEPVDAAVAALAEFAGLNPPLSI